MGSKSENRGETTELKKGVMLRGFGLALGLVGLAALLLVIHTGVAADDDHDREDGGIRGFFEKNDDDDDARRDRLAPVDNPVYKEQCGGCHFAYQPALLPSGSWRKIMGRLEDHFGTSVELDDQDKKIITRYLELNAAERSRAKRARKIVRSLDGRTPMRITEAPYIRRKHDDDDIPAGLFERESMSNCIACHTTADKGIYDDDYVRIPK